ncbi:curlin [Parashewanella spongiae]|uniref:Curlin n=1 Tax=Parashewanella spongiae TaxID=342950 RepID=A0A3A6UL45_9GAMM|nr:curlin [Parashewanella spongiae]MCL1077409.1 curlin [Parashewanella spongiae]RJY18342.1 curlin [Parashewanella spongiae]
MRKLLPLSLITALFMTTPNAVKAEDTFSEAQDIAISLPLESLLFSANRENLISLLQSGSHNNAHLLQIGSQNKMELEQSGDNNFSELMQIGNGNEVELSQLGDNNHGSIIQVGQDNLIQIQQFGNSGFIINQVAENAVLSIEQY